MKACRCGEPIYGKEALCPTCIEEKMARKRRIYKAFRKARHDAMLAFKPSIRIIDGKVEVQYAGRI